MQTGVEEVRESFVRFAGERPQRWAFAESSLDGRLVASLSVGRRLSGSGSSRMGRMIANRTGMSVRRQLFGVVLFLVALVPLVSAQSKAALRLSEASWNFGTLRQADGNLTKSILVHNDGTEGLEILDLHVSCGCLHVKLGKRSILPGESAELMLEIVSAKQVGEIRKVCVIKSNDPRTPTVSIPVEGLIRADWRIEKLRINFGECAAGTSYRQEFKVLHEADIALKLVRLECLDPNIVLGSEPLDDPQTGERGWIVHATLSETAPAGVFAAAINVVTDHPTVPTNHVMLYARILGTVMIRPMSSVRFGRIAEGALIERLITVAATKGAEFTLLSAEATSEDLKVEIIERVAGGDWTIRVSVMGNSKSGGSNEAVLLKTDVKGQEAIRLPVSWSSRPSRRPVIPAQAPIGQGLASDQQASGGPPPE